MYLRAMSGEEKTKVLSSLEIQQSGEKLSKNICLLSSRPPTVIAKIAVFFVSDLKEKKKRGFCEVFFSSEERNKQKQNLSFCQEMKTSVLILPRPVEFISAVLRFTQG